MATATHKICSRCKLDKQASDFFFDKRATTGLHPQCRQCMAERKRELRKVDPSAQRAKWRKDYQDNKDRYVRAALTYRTKNKERVSAWLRNNANIRRTRAREGLSGAEYVAWLTQQIKRCYWCGKRCAKAFHVDHYKPLSRGGKHTADNLVIACPDCNWRKHARDPFEFAREVGRLL